MPVLLPVPVATVAAFAGPRKRAASASGLAATAFPGGGEHYRRAGMTGSANAASGGAPWRIMP
jgi:hypothetical protein